MASILVLDRNDELVEAFAKAAPKLGAEITACHQMARAASELESGTVRVLVAGPSLLSPSGIRFLQRAHEEHPDVVTILISPKAGSDVAPRDLVRTGASDLVRYPSAGRTLKAALERAVGMADTIAGAVSVDGERTALGRAITVTSPTGGCGKTFFATNLAYALATRTGKRVALIDLDLQFGEVITALRLKPQYSIRDFLQIKETDSDASKAQFREFMVRHPSGMEVLAAPKDPAESDSIGSPHISHVLQIAKELYHYVIVDTPAALTEPVLAAFDLSEEFVVMATLDVPSVRNLAVFLSTLDRLKIPKEGVSLILNKAEKDVGLSPAEVERLFPQGFTGVLPYSREVSRSVNSGQPVIESAPGADVSRALRETIARIISDEPVLDPSAASEAQSHAARSVFARLFRRFSLSATS
jgi:pilus assembly protein CpaE